MTVEKSKEVLTPEIFNELFKEAVNPYDLGRLNRGLKYLNIRSAGHYVHMALNEYEDYEYRPNSIFEGEFVRHLKREQLRVSRSWNLVAVLRFGLGARLFSKNIINVYLQFYSYLKRQEDSRYRLGALRMYIYQQRISTYTGDYDLLNRMRKIDIHLLSAIKSERKLNRELIISEGVYHCFDFKVEYEVILKVCELLISDKTNLIERECLGALIFVFSGQFEKHLSVNFPIKWNYRGVELMYLFECLHSFKLIASHEIENIHIKLSKDFIKGNGKTFKPRSLARGSQEIDFNKNSVHEIQKKRGGRYKTIYDIVKKISQIE